MGTYLQQYLCTCREALDLPSFRSAWRRLVARHGVLRNSFHLSAWPEPLQRTSPVVEFPWVEHDWRDLGPAARGRRLREYLEADRGTPFDPARAPLIRFALFRTGEAEYRLLWTSHHALFDGHARRLLLREAFEDYRALRDGIPWQPPRRRPFRDHVEWLRSRDMAPSRAFWREALRGFEAPMGLVLGTGCSGTRGFDTHRLRLPEKLTAELETLARREDVTLNTVLQCAWGLLLGRYTGRTDVVFGAARACRRGGLPGAEEMVGLLTNTVPVRIRVDERAGVGEFFRSVRDHWVAMRPHEHLPLAEIIHDLGLAPGTPLLETLLSFERESAGDALRRLSGEWHRHRFELLQWTGYPLSLVAYGGSRLSVEVTYDRTRFGAEAIRRLVGHLANVLGVFAGDPGRPLGAIDPMGAAERGQVLEAWNPRRGDGGEARCIHELFSAQAALTPGSTALLHRGVRTTYAELDARAGRLAHHLREAGVGPEDRVGVYLERGPALVVALLAVLRSGAAYVPLSPDHPTDRTSFVLEDAGVRLVLTTGPLAERLPRSGARPLLLDAEAEAIARRSACDPGVRISPDQLAYVIYTSGSTGRPKGVMVQHRSVSALLLWLRDLVPDEERSAVLGATAATFDVSVAEVFGTLCWGGTLLLVENALELAGLAEEVRLGVMVPSAAAELLRTGGIPAGLRALNLAGEALVPDLARALQAHGVGTVRNLYGPTEDTVYSTWAVVRPGAERVSIGRAIPGSRAYVLDPSLRPVPVGVPGELYMTGAGLARGYQGSPGPTAERFVPDPYSGEPGARMYRTGDRVRWMEDGELEYLGRTDFQMKVRGYRIEPGEVEAALSAHPAVHDALVMAREDAPGGPRLVAYYTAAWEAPSATALRDHLKARLPEYMVPSAFVRLDAFPRTGSGKLDRGALPAPPTVAGEGGYEAPRTPAEAVLAEAFADVLHAPRVGLRDGFFELGGHSLLVTRLLARVREAFGVELPLQAVFDSPTVEELAREVDRLLAAGVVPLPPVVPGERREWEPVTYGQRGLWLQERLEPGSGAYHLARGLRLRGALRVGALRRALGEVVRRHEVLRTVVAAPGGEPVQRVLPAGPVPLPIVALEVPGAAGRELEARARDFGRAPFDLEAGPLFRAALLRLGAEEHVLVLGMHHMVFDGGSFEVLYRELEALYGAYVRGEASPLAELAVQYADYARWQREHLGDAALERGLSWWRSRLEGAPAELELPADGARPGVRDGRGGEHLFEVGAGVWERVREVGRTAGATPYMMLLGAFQVLLGRYGRTEDVVVGTPVAGRSRREVEGLIGYFVNTLALRTDLSGDPAVGALLGRVREGTLGAYAHQEVPFERVVEAVAPERGRGRTPLFQVMFAYQGAPVDLPRLPGLVAAPVRIDRSTAKFDLTLELEEADGGLRGRVEYAAGMFEAATVTRLARHYGALLEGMAGGAGRRVGELTLLDAAERSQVLEGWNRTRGTEPGEEGLQEPFERQAAARPDAVALVHAGGALTYGELDARAGRLARRLRELGVGPDVVVGLCSERSVEMVVGLLAVLKAGGAYLPLDPAHPAERLTYMLADARPRVLLVHPSARGALPPFAGPVLALDDETPPAGPTGPGDCAEEGMGAGGKVGGSRLAYVIYTSGSTGRPKGVMIAHRSIRNRVLWAYETYPLGAEDVVLLKTPFTFDASIWELFLPLWSGARVVVAPSGGHQDAAYLARALREERVTVLQLVPTMLQALLGQAGLEECRSLRLLFCGGEAFPAEAARRAAEVFGARVVNLYGPTEASIDVSAWEWRGRAEGAVVPIGLPITNTRVYVLDEAMEPVGVGEAGEVYVGGSGLARGYLGRPDLTAEKFVPDPFGAESGGRLYRTGDVGRRRGDGAVEYLGRVDGQVKLRGVRIEPGEIETLLALHPAVREAAVAVREDRPGEARLVGYFAASEGATTGAELRTHLRRSLPEYMLPGAWVRLDALPRTASGKVDRRALPAPGPVASDREHFAPRTPVERALAGIWTEVLDARRVGVRDDFFELGGHSLTAARVVARVRDLMGVEVPLHVIFDAPTVEGVAEWIESVAGEAPRPAPSRIPRASRSTSLPLSFAQRRLWFLDRMGPGRPTYNIPHAFRLRGRLDRAALEGSLAEIVRRHEVLRTVFTAEDGEPAQRILPPSAVALPVDDLTPLVAKERAGAVLRIAALEADTPFDLESGSPFRALLLRLDPEEHVLLLTLHHVAFDGWSDGVLFRELSDLYAAYSSGREPTLPEPDLQYADYAVWQRDRLEGELLERQLAYWRGRLAGAPPLLDLPLDRPRPPTPGDRGERCAVEIPEEVLRGLREVARGEGATLFMALTAGWQLLLARYARQRDVVVGSPVAGRTHAELERVIGLFVNTLPLRADLSPDQTVRDLLRQVRDRVLEAHSSQDVPFERLVEELSPERSIQHTPIFQVVLALAAGSPPGLHLPGLEAEPLRTTVEAVKFDLTLSLSVHGDRLGGSLAFRRELWDRETIERMAGHLSVVLREIAREPDRRVSGVTLLPETERLQVLRAWSAASCPPSSQWCVHHLFEEQARRTPDAVAVACGDRRLTYAELDRRANQLAHLLRGYGVGPDVKVGFALRRSLELPVALLGILKAGGAYVPVDPSYPPERIALTLREIASPLLLTEERLRGGLPDGLPEILLDVDGPRIAREPAHPPRVEVTPDHTVYVIYTSGSTGTPKGTEVPHRAIPGFFQGAGNARFGPGEVVLQHSSTSWDALTLELWPALLTGGTVALYPGESADLDGLAREVERHGVTTLWLSSALFNLVVDTRPEILGRVRQVMTGGEAVSPVHVRRALDAFPGIRLVNGYGPSECTVFATCYPVPVDFAGTAVPIGTPVGDRRVYLFDDELGPVPVGVPGELYVGGPAVPRGYLGRPGLTAEMMVPDPFSDEPGSRLYRTGDLVRWRADGTLEFVGRADQQVKLRGFRIELEEVEAALLAHPAVREAVVVVREDVPGDRRLAGYVTLHEGQSPPTPGALREHLSGKLPEYMVPSAVLTLDSLPLTANRKVDRRALPAPGAVRGEEGYVAPRNRLEATLAGIWAAVLGTERVGVRDGFFDLGGHSLLAVRLVSRVERELGARLPLHAVFRGATVERMAEMMESHAAGETPPRIVPLRAGSGGRPFFFVHAVDGHVLSYIALSRRMRSTRPLYGVQAPGVDGGEPVSRLEELAAAHLTAIRAVQPRGPYALGGWSMGAVVAWEMARRLEAEGERVDVLVMLDPPRAVRTDAALDDAALDDAALLAEMLDPLLAEAHAADAVSPDVDDARMTALLDVRRAHLAALRDYEPGSFAGSAVLLEATERRPAPPGAELRPLHWKALCSGTLQVRPVPGDHFSMFHEPHVRALAAALDASLEVDPAREGGTIPPSEVHERNPRDA